MYLTNDRVITHKYGPGTVTGFERITSVNLPAEKPSEYQAGDRIAVLLDTPSNWPAHSATSGLPYFVPSDLVKGEA
jgi:hypothetical protein